MKGAICLLGPNHRGEIQNEIKKTVRVSVFFKFGPLLIAVQVLS